MSTTPDLTPVAAIERDADSPYPTVWVDYPNAGVDRPRTHGTSVRSQALAERLAAAINAGVAEVEQSVRTDVNGSTYVDSRRLYMGRHLNADLRKLGF